MKKNKHLIALIGLSLCLGATSVAQDLKELTLFDHAIFYDGYNGTVFDADKDDGILRHRNSLYAVKLTDEQMDAFGSKVIMDVTIGARCDNYDRIGNINLALVPKGQETYDAFEVQRLELGRFITPFMNKNRRPNQVPYTYDLNHLSHIMHDKALREQYDLWVEFELFGVPYAAWEQIKGCDVGNPNDVFDGTLTFRTGGEFDCEPDNDVLVPIVMKKPEYKGHNLNNYSEAGTDTIGTCTKTYTFNVPDDVESSHIVLITSNHGANAGGEEYNRRLHLIYIDNVLVMSYIPGGKSCEPYRKYNTQSNGIYNYGAQSDQYWLSFSNWCPGDVIPTRYVTPGPLSAGEHKLMIRVPDAVFNGGQGDIPVSAYYQGLKRGDVGVESVKSDIEPTITVSRKGNTLDINSKSQIERVALYTYAGDLIQRYDKDIRKVDIRQLDKGAYLIVVLDTNGQLLTQKFLK